MNTVQIHASHPYQVLIGTQILENLGAYIKEVCKPGKIAIISDDHVWPLYGAQVCTALEKAGGMQVVHFVFPAGEQSKCGAVYLEILDYLAQAQITRSDCLLALGGGVVGDIAGFAAATYLRGIAYIQLPTTLLAAVDSSVGGKTAIDLPSGKNLAGAFYQPSLVLCDTGTLATLPREIFRDGCAEVIKYAMLFDGELFAHLEQYAMDFDREWVIHRCVCHKRDVVEQDEFDLGLRQKLNLGHTVGHAIEAKSAYGISHGKAVAMGMAIVAKAACTLGYCPEAACKRLLALLEVFGLPTATDYDAKTLYQYTLSDKKRAAAKISLVIPRGIGVCDIVPMDLAAVESFIKEGIAQ